MRILLVAHNFLPGHTGGTEVYTLQLGQQLQRRGHDVHVFTAEKDVGLPDLHLREREYGGLPIIELINNLYYDEFRQTWDHPGIDPIFGAVLDRLQPDVVHFHHLLYLSVGCVEEAARRYLPAVFTLHDYWLQCARYGQRVHADESICHDIDTARCAECLASFKFAQTALEKHTGRLLAGLQDKTGLNLGPAARRLSRSALKPSRDVPFDRTRLDPHRVARRLVEVEERSAELRERLQRAVHLFLSPSRFLRERLVEWGLPADRVRFLPTGVDLDAFRAEPKVPAEHLRVGFLGSLIPAKGPHVLLEAWGLLSAELRARAKLALYGPRRHHPHYLRELEARAARVGAELRGELRRDEVPGALARIDLLVVPSVWYENSPLVIAEALATGTPLLVSDIGGMAELVEVGRTGFHFKTGDARDLARVLAQLVQEPERLDALDREGGIHRVEVDAERMESVYFEAVDAQRAKRLAEEAAG